MGLRPLPAYWGKDMAKCIVTSSTVRIAGQKYRRGDIVEVTNPDEFGTRLQVMPEVKVEEKPKPVRKPRAKKA